MRIQDTIKLSTRMFKTNPARTWLTILGMGVGTAAVVMLVGFGFGLQGILLEQIILGETLLSLNVSNPSSRAVVLDRENVQKLSQLENVKDVAAMASLPALVTFEGLTGNMFLQGADPPFFRYTGTALEKGELFKDGEEEHDRDKVILSAAALKLFGIEDPGQIIGKPVRFRVFVENPDNKKVDEVAIDKDFMVKGVSKENAAITATILLSEFSSHFSVPSYERAQVRVTAADFLTLVQDKIIELGFTVTALSKTVDQANKIFSGVQGVLAAFGGIALIVSAIGMFNTMTVTLLERTNEIGVMRTIGASPTDIRVLFLSESMVVGTLGGLVGIGIGVSVGIVLNLLVNILATQFGGVSITLFRYPLWFLLFISGFSGVVGFMTGVFPARKASKLNPLDAIRYK